MPKLKIVVAASFTAEPVEDTLLFWLRELAIDAEIEFAPYHQIHQQLLDGTSTLARNRDGINVVLMRLQDWPSPQQVVQELADALRQAASRSSAAHLVLCCPPSPAARQLDQQELGEQERRFCSRLDSLPGVYAVSSAALLDLYPHAAEHDAEGERSGHIPYTPTAFAALGTMIARQIHALKFPPYKVIALDCDNTLWKGVCGEDGPLGVKVDAGCAALQQLAAAKREAGMVLCLCSKNEEEDVDQVFLAQPEMPLRRPDFAISKINWQPKSENLRALSAELRLGLDSFVFLDDSPIECSEVRTACPEVLTLRVPAGQETVDFLKHLWGLDTLKVTEEDRARNEQYRQNVQREAFQSQVASFREFLDNLNLVVAISPMREGQSARVSQLTLRTNQFNTTTIRRSEPEILELCRPGGYECVTVEVRDRFGDYGLVGALLFTATNEALLVDSYLLSCRALGRGVEHRMLSRLGEIARERGLGRVDIVFRPSAKNRPAGEFLRIGQAFRDAAGDGGESLFRFPAEFAVAATYNPEITAASEAVRDTPPAAPAAAGPLDAVASLSAARRSVLLQKIAEEYRAAPGILRAVEAHKRRHRPELAQSYVAPRSQRETDLAEIWSRILQVAPVGVRDSFFDLGGTSLLAVGLFSEIRRRFGRRLPLTTLLNAPSIEKLAAVLESETEASTSALVAIQPAGSRLPFFCVHGNNGKVLLFRQLGLCLGEDQPFYGVEARDLEDHEVHDIRIEGLAAGYAAEIRAFQPQGPYQVGGFCGGGLIALEIARILLAQRQEVALVALLDPPLLKLSSFWRHPLIVTRALALQARRFARRGAAENLAFVRRVFQNVTVGVRDRIRKARQPKDWRPTESEVSLPKPLLNIRLANRRAVTLYDLRPYPGKVTLFLCSQSSGLWNALSEAEWRAAARGGMDVRTIPGSHGEFFEEPQVSSLAADLHALMQKSPRRSAGGRNEVPRMRFHHVGCAVPSIAAALPAYRKLSANIGEPVLVVSQNVRVCFIELGPDFYLELVEPAAEDSAVSTLLHKKVSYYHNGFLVDDFDDAARELESQGATPLEVFESEAFGGRRCQFFLNSASHLIEIMEAEGGAA